MKRTLAQLCWTAKREQTNTFLKGHIRAVGAKLNKKRKPNGTVLEGHAPVHRVQEAARIPGWRRGNPRRALKAGARLSALHGCAHTPPITLHRFRWLHCRHTVQIAAQRGTWARDVAALWLPRISDRNHSRDKLGLADKERNSRACKELCKRSAAVGSWRKRQNWDYDNSTRSLLIFFCVCLRVSIVDILLQFALSVYCHYWRYCWYCNIGIWNSPFCMWLSEFHIGCG